MASEFNKGVWAEEEHEALLAAKKRRLHWREVARIVGTRSRTQCISHWQKYHDKLLRRVTAGGSHRTLAPRTEHRIDPELLKSIDMQMNEAHITHALDAIALVPNDGVVHSSVPSPNDVVELTTFSTAWMSDGMPVNDDSHNELAPDFSGATGDLGAHGAVQDSLTDYIPSFTESSEIAAGTAEVQDDKFEMLDDEDLHF